MTVNTSATIELENIQTAITSPYNEGAQPLLAQTRYRGRNWKAISMGSGVCCLLIALALLITAGILSGKNCENASDDMSNHEVSPACTNVYTPILGGAAIFVDCISACFFWHAIFGEEGN